MKKYLLTFLGFLLVQLALGQDLIIKISGDEIKAKVLEVSLKEILYRAPDSVEGNTFTIPKSEVFMIRYANGTKEFFQKNELALKDTSTLAHDPEQLYQLGLKDARHYKKGSKYLNSDNKGNMDPAFSYKNDPNYRKGFDEGTRLRNGKKAGLGLILIGGLGAFMLLISAVL